MAFTAGKANVKKINYNVWLICPTSTSFTSYTQIGACLAEPSIIEEKGEEVKLNDGTNPITSKNCSVAFTIVNVSNANYDSMREIINKDSSVILTTRTSGVTAATAGDWSINTLSIFPALSIKGNAINQIECTGSKEVSPDDVACIAGA